MELSKEQRKVVSANDRFLQVVAAAGSGKTRTMIALAEDSVTRGMNPARILMLSFSRKACSEIRSRLSESIRSEVRVSTFHSLAFRSMMRRREMRGVRVLTDQAKFEFMRGLLCHAKTDGIPYSVLLANKRLFREQFPDLCMSVYRELAEYKRSNRLVEFDDMVLDLNRELRLGHLRDLRKSFDLIIVDEFQDTDPGQLQFLQMMDSRRLVVVGDDYQSIYGFRGSDPELFLKFQKHFPGARVLSLSENYRSQERIVRAGNHFIRSSRKQLRKKVRAMRGGTTDCVALSVSRGEEAEVAALVNASGGFILCRSNYRRIVWERAGVEPDRLLTIHSAKGLEFPIVYLDLCGGWSSARGSRVPDEEVRVAYVGLSRAENWLVVMHDESGTSGPERAVFELFRNEVQRYSSAALQRAMAA
jgi:DNA helicase-2/ATP-dependent DNA helicase PcrA